MSQPGCALEHDKHHGLAAAAADSRHTVERCQPGSALQHHHHYAAAAEDCEAVEKCLPGSALQLDYYYASAAESAVGLSQHGPAVQHDYH